VSSVTSKCNQATSFDSLFDSDGAPNFFHYYWRIYWMNTPSGPVAVTLEDGTSHVFITDLNSGKKVLAFSRALGINGIVVKQNGEGTVAITANLAFNHEQIPDAVAFLQQGKDVKTVETTSGAAAQVVAPASGSAVLSTQ